MKTKLNPETLVKSKFPGAVAVLRSWSGTQFASCPDVYIVYTQPGGRVLATGRTEAQVWLHASCVFTNFKGA